MGSPFDALLPDEMAEKAEQVGIAKAGRDAVSTFALAVLAGAFIALGAIFATTVATGSAAIPWGVARLLIGIVFSLGLVLVIIAGAELFTGNNLIVMAWAARRVSTAKLWRNWFIVFAGNAFGAVATAGLVVLAGHHSFAGGAVGSTAMKIAVAKCSLTPVAAVSLGILCNALVCLAVWLSFSARTASGKVLVIIGPIAAFVAAGFEHSIANLYFVPVGLLIDLADPSFLAAMPSAAAEALTVSNFLWRNLLPVAIGNIIGGAGLVGLVYWFIYLRPRRRQ
ncbi:MAG: formate/nitrite transporter family protein [Myxococcales bacterium]|nr:formate/nitrite transporter family protein [Myxococcales bacterium]